MKKKSDQLDHIVKDKLSQLQVPYNPEHWTQFERMLNAQEAGTPPVWADRSLDEAIFEKLHEVKAPNQVAHWERLAARLNEQTDVRRKLLFYKLTEATLLLLLLLFVSQNFLPPAAGVAQPEQVLQENSRSSSPNEQARSANQAPTATNPNQTALSAVKPNNHLPAQNENLRGTADHAPKIQQDYIATNNSVKAISGQNTIIRKSQSISPSLPVHSHEVSTPKTSSISLSTEDNSGNLYAVTPQRIELLNSLEQIMLSELKYADTQQDYVALISPIVRRPALVVSMFGSGDYNQIITPRGAVGDKIYDAWLRYAPGYSGGITVGLEAGRWEIGGGAIYSAKRYEPNPIIYLGGSFFDNSYDAEGLKYMELNMVQLPLYFRYNFIYHDKWRAYTTLGLSLQVNLQTNYYFADDESFDLPRPLPRPSEPYNPPKQKLPGGWLDGGVLWQNGYISGNIGLGLERYMNGRWSIFVQPTYHHSLNYFTQGVGPYKDRINTMSIFTGVRVRLND